MAKSQAEEVLLSLWADLIRVDSTSITAAGSSTYDWAAEVFFPTVTVYAKTSSCGEVQVAVGEVTDAVSLLRCWNIGSSEVSSPCNKEINIDTRRDEKREVMEE